MITYRKKENLYTSPADGTAIGSFYGGRLIVPKKLPAIITAQEIPRVISSSSTGVTTDADRSVNRSTAEIYLKDYVFTIDWKGFKLPETTSVTFSSNDSSIATIDSTGKVTHVSNGTVTFVAEIPEFYLTIRRTVNFSPSGGSVVDEFLNFVAGSVGKHASDNVDTRIDGTDRDVARHLYLSFPSNSNYDSSVDATRYPLPATDKHLQVRGGVDEFIRNPDFWAADIDHSCISPSVLSSGSTTHRRSPSVTAITPWHYVTATHYQPSVGERVTFVPMNSTTPVFRTIIGRQKVFEDLTVGIFDEELPVTVKPAKILPSDIAQYLPIQRDVPGLLLDQQEHGMVHELNLLGLWKFPKTGTKRYEFVDTPEDNRVWASYGIEYYDSSSPSFLIINNDLAVICCWYGGGGGSGPSITYYSADIQNVINNLSTINNKPLVNLSYIDLSAFNQY